MKDNQKREVKLHIKAECNDKSPAWPWQEHPNASTISLKDGEGVIITAQNGAVVMNTINRGSYSSAGEPLAVFYDDARFSLAAAKFDDYALYHDYDPYQGRAEPWPMDEYNGLRKRRKER